jgi:hypothetical protein
MSRRGNERRSMSDYSDSVGSVDSKSNADGRGKSFCRTESKVKTVIKCHCVVEEKVKDAGRLFEIVLQ